MNRNSNIVIKLGAVVFLLVGIFTIARLEMKYNDIETQKDALLEQYYENQELLEEIQRELEAEFNDEYVIKIAKEKAFATAREAIFLQASGPSRPMSTPSIRSFPSICCGPSFR